MVCRKILFESALDELVSATNSFDFFEFEDIPNSLLSEQNDSGDISKEISVIFIGKTGYGKSTLLNKIINQHFFATSDVASCTKTMQVAKFKLPKGDNCYFTLCDLPGIGENVQVDKEYLKLYAKMVSQATVVVYLLRADQRDFAIDERAFELLFSEDLKHERLIIALNCVDKVEPINREIEFELTEKQKNNIELKKQDIASSFGVESCMIREICSTNGYGLSMLLFAIHINVQAVITKKQGEEFSKEMEATMRELKDMEEELLGILDEF